MDTALPQKFPFILDRNLAKANCTGNRVCMSCDIVVLGHLLGYWAVQAQGGGGQPPLVVWSSYIPWLPN